MSTRTGDIAAPNATSSAHPVYADRSGFAYSDDPEFGIGTAQDQAQLRARFVPLLSTSGLLAAPAAAPSTASSGPGTASATATPPAPLHHQNVPVAQSLLSSVPSSPLAATSSGAIPAVAGGGVVVAPTAALKAWAAAGGVVSATATGGPAEGPGASARQALVATLDRMTREDVEIDALVTAAFAPSPP